MTGSATTADGGGRLIDSITDMAVRYTSNDSLYVIERVSMEEEKVEWRRNFDHDVRWTPS